ATSFLVDWWESHAARHPLVTPTPRSAMTPSVFRSVGRALLALVVLAAPALSQTRGFLVRLGNDTTTVERFTKTGDRIEGTRVGRSPVTTVLKYVITLNTDGSIASYQQSQTRADGSAIPNAPA